ncbi:MAG: hypothetical protein M3081_17240 [Gemmatimonadota bacterium]|nr:hypothetical protein [Gemmatimonadota bacterium]
MPVASLRDYGTRGARWCWPFCVSTSAVAGPLPLVSKAVGIDHADHDALHFPRIHTLAEHRANGAV